jgi:very-short-patch-repair endonuclease
MPRPPRSTPQTKHFAVELLHALTPAERKLWNHLRNDQLGVNFRRQHAIGPYITDFCCIEKKLILELDGPPFGRSTWNKPPMMPSERLF